MKLRVHNSGWAGLSHLPLPAILPYFEPVDSCFSARSSKTAW